jgi:hypothetical protein
MQPSAAAIAAWKKAVEADELYPHMEENNGLCLACGEWKYGGCEPDARDYECEACGTHAVYGAEECLIMIGEVGL